jgi:allophanate hydrolase
LTETVAAIVARTAPASGRRRKRARSYRRIRDHNDPAIFISLCDEKDVLAEAERLARRDAAQLPLYGVPVAVKDNIDVLGMPTTAACPAFSYMPTHDSTAVAKLREAGAIIIGKTNLDQFATGLVGVRSPYGIPRNAIRADLIPRIEFSSVVAVPRGWCRWRSAPTPPARRAGDAQQYRWPCRARPGLTAGVVPACRTLIACRCSRIVDDAMTVEGDGGAICRSVLGQPAARRDDFVSRWTQARHSPQRATDRLRRPPFGESLWGGAEALERARRNAGRIRPRAVL